MRNAVLHWIYLKGYSGFKFPASFRRMIAGSEIHRAWFLGFTGHFAENGVRYGLANQRPQERTLPFTSP